MKKSFFTIITLTLLFAMLMPFFSSVNVEARTFPQTSTTDPIKPWTITFNEAVLNDQENLKRIYVQTVDNKKIEISIKLSADLKKVIVLPENQYIFSGTYTLVIPKGFKSSQGQETTEDTSKTFKIEGRYIEDVTATVNPLLTNIIVNGTDDIANVEVSINNANAVKLIPNGTHFSKGFQGLLKGDRLIIRVYDKDNNSLETQAYNVN
ncbi:chromosome segregation ATPase [Solibacillus silvestris StLB046]|uniref:Chromosome segregation ATPase n=1 Tax=Solibacillus silvestris (strain StLB046) TaxID=1002809 RepID=F2F3W2_SOLSS|nr:Ig-like domain-containing protein [Solibacillus silvestris]BAK17760.1 chromosome segregation ATPase [Solibacillus silvestris StLB046]